MASCVAAPPRPARPRDRRAEHARKTMSRPVSTAGAVCECGDDKNHDDEACARCMYLDGDETLRGKVIEALRGTDGLSLRELALAIYGRAGIRNQQRGLLRIVQDLMRRERIRRYEGEGLEVETTGWRGCKVRHQSACWIYQLWGEAE